MNLPMESFNQVKRAWRERYRASSMDTKLLPTALWEQRSGNQRRDAGLASEMPAVRRGSNAEGATERKDPAACASGALGTQETRSVTSAQFERGLSTLERCDRPNQLLGASAGLSVAGSAAGFFIIE
jgi:hypothetical protein